MPRYHFHVHDGRSSPDIHGTDMPDVHTAGIEAIRFAGEVLKDDAQRVSAHGSWRLEVTDDLGCVLFDMSFVIG